LIGQTPQPRKKKKKTFLLTVTPIDQHLKKQPHNYYYQLEQWVWVPLPSVEEVVDLGTPRGQGGRIPLGRVENIPPPF
jgi:hypothetical protein